MSSNKKDLPGYEDTIGKCIVIPNEVNPNEIDTTGRKICPGDLVLVFNGDGGPNQDKKWSYEKIHENFETKELYSVFAKYLMDIETKVKNIKPEWIVIIKQNESLIFHHDNFGFKG